MEEYIGGCKWPAPLRWVLLLPFMVICAVLASATARIAGLAIFDNPASMIHVPGGLKWLASGLQAALVPYVITTSGLWMIPKWQKAFVLVTGFGFFVLMAWMFLFARSYHIVFDSTAGITATIAAVSEVFTMIYSYRLVQYRTV